MKILHIIFDKSSIHGLPYLTPRHHGPLGRLVWLLCVLVSFSLAGLVIWKNVESWQSQPAVVSSVEYALVEDQPWLPQIVVCPSSLNPMAMLDGLIQATYQQVMTPERMTHLELILAKVKIMDDYYLSSRTRIDRYFLGTLNLTSYESCFQHIDEISEKCDLVLILAVLLDKFGFNNAQVIAVTYAAKSVVKDEAASFLDYVMINHNVSLEDINNASPTMMTEYNGLLQLYQTFFVVLDEVNDELIEPQPLKLYIQKVPPITMPGKRNIGFFYSWILNGYGMQDMYRKANDYQYNAIHELSDFMLEVWLDALKVYIKVGSHRKALLLMNLFWHGDIKSSLFQPTEGVKQNGYLCSTLPENYKFSTVNQVCKGNTKIGLECTKYCSLLMNMSSETQNRVKEVLQMGLDSHILPLGNFQSCQHPIKGLISAKECWKAIVNEKGICYTSKGNGALTNIVPGVMEDAPFRFILDGSQYIQIFEDTPDNYRLETYAAEMHRRMLNIHVAPYHQNAIEDKLMEGEKKDEMENFAISSHDPHSQFYFRTPRTQQIWVHIEYIRDSSDTFKAMHPKQKKCYLPKNEKKLKNFDEYSEADCMLECAWDLGIELCHCVPWYLADMYPDSQICEVFGNRCFKNIIDSRYKKDSQAKEQCQSTCLLNCDMIQYSGISRKWYEGGNYYTDKIDPQLENDYFTEKVKAIPQDVLSLADNNTSRFLPRGNMFALELRLSNSKLAQTIVRTATMTTTDLVSNVGGTLGLFCGLSVLSLVEIFYWTGRTIWNFINKRGLKQQWKNVYP